MLCLKTFEKNKMVQETVLLFKKFQIQMSKVPIQYYSNFLHALTFSHVLTFIALRKFIRLLYFIYFLKNMENEILLEIKHIKKVSKKSDNVKNRSMC